MADTDSRGNFHTLPWLLQQFARPKTRNISTFLLVLIGSSALFLVLLVLQHPRVTLKHAGKLLMFVIKKKSCQFRAYIHRSFFTIHRLVFGSG